MTKPEKKTEKRTDRPKAGRRFLDRLLRNFPLKLLSLLLAIALWAGLISQDPSLTREKTFTDVIITVNGADTLKRNGFIMVSDLTDQLTATMTAAVPQTQYQNASASNYNPRIDLSRIRREGIQTVSVTTSTTGTYGSVESISPAEIQVEVEAYVTRYRIPVTVNTVGEPGEGYWCTTAASNPQMVVVSGPRSQVQSISRAVATLDLSQLPAQEGSLELAVPFTLVDLQGNAIESSLIEVTSESVLLDSLVVSLTLYPQKEIQLSGLSLTDGEPAEGYEVTGITVQPEAVTVAAQGEVLESLEALYVSSAVNLNGKEQTFQSEVRLRRPSGVAHLSADSATVTVEIAPVMMERIFRSVRISADGINGGLSASLSQRTVDVTIRGPQLSLANVKQSQIAASVDLSKLTEPGTYEVPVVVSAGDDEDFTLAAEPASITVELTSK